MSKKINAQKYRAWGKTDKMKSRKTKLPKTKKNPCNRLKQSDSRSEYAEMNISKLHHRWFVQPTSPPSFPPPQDWRAGGRDHPGETEDQCGLRSARRHLQRDAQQILDKVPFGKVMCPKKILFPKFDFVFLWESSFRSFPLFIRTNCFQEYSSKNILERWKTQIPIFGSGEIGDSEPSVCPPCPVWTWGLNPTIKEGGIFLTFFGENFWKRKS